TANSYNNLALLLNSVGKYAEAEPLFRKALEIRRRALGEDHPDTAASYDGLAVLLQSVGKHAEAEPLHRQALEIYRPPLPHPHRPTPLHALAPRSNLRPLLRTAGGTSAAPEPLFRKPLETPPRPLAAVLRYTATSYNNLAGLLNSVGKHAEAEPLQRKALEIFR